MRPLRLTARLLGFAILGAAVSLALAEAAVLWSPVRPCTQYFRPLRYSTGDLARVRDIGSLPVDSRGSSRLAGFTDRPADPASLEIPDDLEAVNIAIVVDRGPGLEIEHLNLDDRPVGANVCMANFWSLRNLRAGWPARCLTARSTILESDAWPPFIDAEPAPRWLYPTRNQSVLDPTPLATTILPAGLALDTTFYSIILLTLTSGRRALLHLLRLRRNRCPRCNYNRQGLPPDAPCPECGPPPA